MDTVTLLKYQFVIFDAFHYCAFFFFSGSSISTHASCVWSVGFGGKIGFYFQKWLLLCLTPEQEWPCLFLNHLLSTSTSKARNGAFRISVVWFKERLPDSHVSFTLHLSPHQVKPHPLLRVQKRKEEDPVSELCFMRGWNGHFCGFCLSVQRKVPEAFETCQFSCFNWEDVIPALSHLHVGQAGGKPKTHSLVLRLFLCFSTESASKIVSSSFYWMQ